MLTQFLKKTSFLRTISFIAAVSFVLSSVPVSYASTDSLRPRNATARGADRGFITAFEHDAIRRVLARLDARNTKYRVQTGTFDGGQSIFYVQAVPGMTEAIRQETGGSLIRGHYTIRPDEKGISYIYIDADTYRGRNGEDYIRHEIDELKAIREFARDEGWTLDELVKWLDETGGPDEVEKVLAQIHDEAPELPEEAVEIVKDIPARVMLAAATRRAVRGAVGLSQIPAINLVTMTMDELKTRIQQRGINSGFIALDWNVGKVDKTEDLERINKSVPTIAKVFNETGIQYLYGFTHRGRPKGAGFEDDAKLKLRPVIDKAKDFLQGLDIEIVPLSYDLEKVAQEIVEAKEKYKGKKIFFIFENIRFYPAEQSKDAKVREEFEKKLIALTGQSAEQLVYFSEAFDKAHRGKEASMELVQRIPKENRAAGVALEQDLNAVIGFLQGIRGKVTVLFGGAKFDKFANIATVSEGILKQRKGTLLIVGAQANAWEKFANNKELGASLLPKDDEIEEIQAAVETIKSSGVQVLAPLDYMVKLGTALWDSPQTVLAKDMSQVDIGPETIELFRQHFRALKAGDGLVLNGGAGMFDKGSPRGTFALIEEAEAAADRGVSVLFAGGDMDIAAREYERAKKRELNPKIKRTTGGGVVWTIIAKNIIEDPKAMPAIEAVLKPAAPSSSEPEERVRIAQELNVKADKLRGIIQAADTTVHNGVGVTGFDNVVNSLKGLTDTKGALVIGAHTIFENAGIITTLRKIKEARTDLKVAMWVDDEATVETLKAMGVEEVADIIISGGFSLDAALNQLRKSGIAEERIVLINSDDDLTDLLPSVGDASEYIENILRLKAIRVNAPSAETGNINAMPLVIARAIAGIFKDETSVTTPYKELVQNYKVSGQISGEDLAALNDLTSQISTVPLVKVNEDIAQAAVTYEIASKEVGGEV